MHQRGHHRHHRHRPHPLGHPRRAQHRQRPSPPLAERQPLVGAQRHHRELQDPPRHVGERGFHLLLRHRHRGTGAADRIHAEEGQVRPFHRRAARPEERHRRLCHRHPPERTSRPADLRPQRVAAGHRCGYRRPRQQGILPRLRRHPHRGIHQTGHLPQGRGDCLHGPHRQN